jgi:hypothetical protein
MVNEHIQMQKLVKKFYNKHFIKYNFNKVSLWIKQKKLVRKKPLGTSYLRFSKFCGKGFTLMYGITLKLRCFTRPIIHCSSLSQRNIMVKNFFITPVFTFLKFKNFIFYLKKRRRYINRYNVVSILNVKKKLLVIFKKTKNNYFLTLVTYNKGHVISKCTAGIAGIKTKKEKKARDAFFLVCRKFVRLCKLKNVKSIYGLCLYKFTRRLRGSIFFIRTLKFALKKESIKYFKYIYFLNMVSHNGLRKKKVKRL